MNWIVPAYFAVGFVVVVAEFALVGPREMWAKLIDSDPNEPKFAFTKTTTPERARRDDDHFGAWMAVLMGFFAWPLLLGFGAVMGAVWLMLFCAKKVAMLFRDDKEGASHA